MRLNSLAAAAASSLILLAGCGGSDSSGLSSSALPSRQAGLISSSTSSATFSGNRSAYTIARTATGFTVTENANGAASPVGASVQTLVFDDVTVSLAIGDKTKTVSTANLTLLVEMYIAFFNRVPDAEGIAFWITKLNEGQSLDTIAQSFYDVATTTFSSVTGYSTGMSNEAFITIIYKNVLGRDEVDAGGMAYWTNALATGARTRGALVREILQAAHGYKSDPTYGWVANLLDNKYAVGSYFALRNGLTYRAANSYALSQAISAKVTPTDTTAAIASIGMSDTNFDLPSYSVSVSNAAASTLMYKKPVTITLTGVNFDRGLTLQSGSCTGLSEVAGRTTTQVAFTCTPTQVGNLSVVVVRTSDSAPILALSLTIPQPQVTFTVGNGTMVFELYPQNAPVTVDNFLRYVDEKFYDATLWHRSVKSSFYIIQGGGFDTAYNQKTTHAPIVLESPNGLTHARGTIAMARTSDPNSATSQFFVNSQANNWGANNEYAVFGKILSGLDVMDAIQAAQTASGTAPNGVYFADIPNPQVVTTSITRTK